MADSTANVRGYGKGFHRCGYCGVRFPQKVRGPTQIYCCTVHRVYAYKLRRAELGQKRHQVDAVADLAVVT